MAKAICNGAVIAQSDRYEVLEGNLYCPEGSLDRQYVRPSDKMSVCGRKGTCNYFDLVVDGEVSRKAVWVYNAPKPEAQKIRATLRSGKALMWSAEIGKHRATVTAVSHEGINY